MSRPLLLIKAHVKAHTRRGRDGRRIFVSPYSTRAAAAHQPSLPLGAPPPRQAAPPPASAPPPAEAAAADRKKQIADDAAWQAILARGKAMNRQADELAAHGKPVRFKDERYGLTYLASADTYRDGDGFRLTTFRDGQPVGHMNAKTLREAIFEALKGGAVVVESGSRAPTPRQAAPAIDPGDYAPATVRGWGGETVEVPNVAHARLFNLGRKLIGGGTADPAEVAHLWEHFRGWVEHDPPTFPFAGPEHVPQLAMDYADRYSTEGVRKLTAVVDPDEAADYFQRGLRLAHGHPLAKALEAHILGALGA